MCRLMLRCSESRDPARDRLANVVDSRTSAQGGPFGSIP
ncbi:hypothetical protein BURMUCGD1_5109 [Burkholderia multivorans CGD1]|nr:hypothetical protein BURMUCGD1_5109 [Burkholderia multivorans CGD1]